MQRLQQLAEALDHHWNAILEIQRELYEDTVRARAEIRERDRILRKIEQITHAAIRVAPPRLEAVRSVDTKP